MNHRYRAGRCGAKQLYPAFEHQIKPIRRLTLKKESSAAVRRPWRTAGHHRRQSSIGEAAEECRPPQQLYFFWMELPILGS